MKYLLMVLCLFFDILYIICKSKNKNVAGLFVKTAAAVCFLTIAYLGYINHKTTYTYMILCGLTMYALGDICLGLRNIFLKNIMFGIGAISFLIGHIVFIIALFPLNNIYKIECIIIGIIIGTILFAILYKVCRINRNFMIIGILYCTMISIMASLSVGIYVTSNTISNLIFMLGAGLFVSSDIILIMYNFSRKEKWMHPVYSLLYFIAQILISFSLHLI